ncbi:alpha/beta hydrolase [Xylocopilactobacillus apis]|uniref:Alpha/beta hydrolase n=1 Tax=Xylocopilactobacillus apis TaxID=2932183 RepID=A0AAU9CS98_9LACO|nr:alpha/beta hydrolase [Xylocopilactobacillus apis]BDR56857.1 alpha/beta hydrolase [Xylocopilactobacillus apis]
MKHADNYIFDLSDNVTRTPVHYKNRFGIKIAADLYLPKSFDKSKKYPAIIVGAPYGGVKEQSPGLYANVLAQRDFAVLTFDPSYNGYSSGSPRHLSSPEIFVEDFSAAVDYLGTRDFVNRDQIGVIGICGSGGFALSAAQVDHRIKAVATVSMYDIARTQRYGLHDSMTKSQRDQYLDELGEQRYLEFLGNEPTMTPRGAAINFDENTDPISREFGEFYSTERGYHPNSISQFTMTSSMAFNNFSLLDHLEDISPRPILLVAGENAHSKYFSDDVYEKAKDPKELLIIPNAGHVDLYDKMDLIPFDKFEEFFKSIK